MSAPSECPRCGTKLPTKSLDGLCPRCVGNRLFAAEVETQSPALPFDLADDSVGLKLGRYLLVEKLGEGGCGVVYAAEQEVPIRRRVALKVIKLGMDTRAVVARFEAERQALAMMDHPNIAKVFDAGATAAGRPYFVMELVEGVRITDYCEQKKLSIEARIELFITVCQAVQHAHQKGIIHRDLKPSNILLAEHDGAAVPKIIDFGIAKATEQRLTESTLVTEAHQFLGTPAYMSPEQAASGAADLDTRSDIYSLGVVLYELLTGRTPLDAEELRRSGPDEARRMIREVEPVRPSAQLPGEARLRRATISSEARRAEQASPPEADSDGSTESRPTYARRIPSDLDWIVMKCLEKDRARRYESAAALAEDLRRHLADEPVTAAAPTAGYQFRKFARRNRLALAVAVVIFTVLLAATVVSSWQALRASKASQRAKHNLVESERAREEAEAMSAFLTKVFQSPDPKQDGRTVTVAETLGRAANQIETDLTDHPERRAKLQTTLGATYRSLGLYREAISIQEKVRDYYQTAFGPGHSNTLQAIQSLALSHDKAGHDGEALKLRQESVSRGPKVSGPGQIETLQAMSSLADSYRKGGQLELELKLREKVLALSRDVLGSEHPDTLAAIFSLADAPAGKWEDRLKLWEELLPLCRKVHGPEDRNTIEALGGLADAADVVRQIDKALARRQELVALTQSVLGRGHPDTINAVQRLKRLCLFDSRYAAAEPLLTSDLARAREAGSNNLPQIKACLAELAEFRFRQEQYPSAETIYREVLQHCQNQDGAEVSVLAIDVTGRLGGVLADWAWTERSTNPPAAAEHARQAVTLLRQVNNAAVNDPRITTNRFANLQSRLGGALCVAAFTDHALDSTAREALLTESESLLFNSRQILKPVRAPQAANYRDCLTRLVRLYEAWGKPAELAKWRKKLADFEKEELAPVERERTPTIQRRSG